MYPELVSERICLSYQREDQWQTPSDCKFTGEEFENPDLCTESNMLKDRVRVLPLRCDYPLEEHLLESTDLYLHRIYLRMKVSFGPSNMRFFD